LQAPFLSSRLADFPQIPAYSVAVTCSARQVGPGTVTILGQAIATIRVDEACETSSLNWRFVDSYWLDPKTGFAWRTRQHLAPDGETVDTEIFRPPG
jgi:Group 4 capsule polysaccharide lipoprotein gfcB, YjbF